MCLRCRELEDPDVRKADDWGLALTKSQLRLRVLLQGILIFHETDSISDIVLFSGGLGAGICMLFHDY